MGSCRADLLTLLGAVTVTSANSFTFAGTGILCDGTPPDALPTRLQGELYQHTYCRRFDGERREHETTAPPDGGLIELLPAPMPASSAGRPAGG